MNKIDPSILERLKQNDPTLKTLDLSNRYLNDNDIQLLAQALSHNTFLLTLNVSGNRIRGEGAKALADNSHTTTLNISYNQVGDEGAKAFAANTHITTLYIGCNQIGDEGAKALATNSRITTLYINLNNVGDEGAKDLATNTHITILYINLNNVGDEGAKALAANRCITTLNISANQIRDDGGKALAANPQMTSLNIMGNDIGNDGAQALLSNTQLTQLNISNNNIPPHLEAQLYKAVTLNRKAKQLRFTEHLIEIAKAARYHRTDSLLPLLPNDILKIILAYVAINAAQDPQNVMPVCNLLLKVIRGSGNPSSVKPPLQWSDVCPSKFFKAWNLEENQEVRSRMVKPVVNEESNAGQHRNGING